MEPSDPSAPIYEIASRTYDDRGKTTPRNDR